MEEELKCKTQRSPVVPPTQARDLQDTFLFPCPFHASGFLPQRVPCCNEIPTPAPRQTGRLCVQQGTASPQQAVFKQALLCGWFHRSLRCTWARQMTEQNAQSTLKEMEAEGISLSLLLVASAQLWSGGREEMSPIPLNGLLLTPSAACRFPARGTQEAVAPSEARRKCSSRPGKRAAEMKRSDETQHYQLLLWPLQTEQSLTHDLWAPHLVDLTNGSLWFLEGKKNNKTLPLGHATHPTYRYHLSFIW